MNLPGIRYSNPVIFGLLTILSSQYVFVLALGAGMGQMDQQTGWNV